MDRFKLDENRMDQLREIFTQLDIELTGAHEEMKTLLAAMEETNSWIGQSKEKALVYMRLLEQYHGALSSDGTEQPVSEAIKAMEECMKLADNFYNDFEEYKILEGD